MKLAEIYTELACLQSELESLQGGVDAKRFLGASMFEFSEALNGAWKQGVDWTATRSTDPNCFLVRSKSLPSADDLTVQIVLFRPSYVVIANSGRTKKVRCFTVNSMLETLNSWSWS
jgi:hypothetical protein